MMRSEQVLFKQLLKFIEFKKEKSLSPKIDKARIERSKYKHELLHFIDVVTTVFKDEDLMHFYNNINTLEIEEKPNNSENELIKGSYNSIENKITIEENNTDALYHELFHMLSTFYDKLNNKIHTGFYVGKARSLSVSIGKGINEGYTELLKERYFASENNNNFSYTYELATCKSLEEIVGKDTMQSIYSNSDLLGLIRELEKYAELIDIIKFIVNVDYIMENTTGKKNLFFKKKSLAKKIKEVNKFLLYIYFRKLKTNSSDFTDEEIKNNSLNFVKSLTGVFTINNYSFDTLTSKDVRKVRYKLEKESEYEKDLTRDNEMTTNKQTSPK